MKKITFSLLPFLFLFTGCLTVGRIERNCDKFAQICTTPVSTVIEYRDTTIYRTDTLWYSLPPDTVRLVEKITVTGTQASIAPVKRKKGIIWMEASITNNWLNVTAGLTDSTILIPHIDTVYIKDAIQNTTTTQTITIEKKYIPKFYKFTFWLVMAQLVAFVGFIVFEVIGTNRIKGIFKR
jgi:hypothetical protein